jgi:hypothetical protein
VPRLRMHGTMPPLPHISSWQKAWLSKHINNFTLRWWWQWWTAQNFEIHRYELKLGITFCDKGTACYRHIDVYGGSNEFRLNPYKKKVGQSLQKSLPHADKTEINEVLCWSANLADIFVLNQTDKR